MGEGEGGRVGDERIAPVVAPDGQGLVTLGGWRGNGCERRRAATSRGTNGSHHTKSAQAPRWAARDDLHVHQRLEDVAQEPQPGPRQEPAVQGPPARRRRLPQPDREPDDHHRVEDHVEGERRHVRGEEGTVVEKRDEGEVAEEAEDEEGRARHLEDAEEVGRGQLVAPIGGEAGGEQQRRVEAHEQSVLDERGGRPRGEEVARPTRVWASQNAKAVDQRSQKPALGGGPDGAQSPADGEDERAEQNDDRRVQRVVLEGTRREDGPHVGHGHHEHHEERGRYDPVAPECRDHPGDGSPTRPAGQESKAAAFSATKRRFMPVSPTCVRPGSAPGRQG